LGALGAVCVAGRLAAAPEAAVDLGTARLIFDAQARATLVFADGARWLASGQPAFALEADGATFGATATELAGDRTALTVRFANGEPTWLGGQSLVPVAAGLPLEGTESRGPRSPDQTRCFWWPGDACANQPFVSDGN
jgi:hypothetical protein